MTEFVFNLLLNKQFLIGMLVAISVFATIITIVPQVGGSTLKARMKAVALERDELRARQRVRLGNESDRRKGGLRGERRNRFSAIVERLDLKRALADESTTNKLKIAGYRSATALTTFLFFRIALPIVFFIAAFAYIFGLGEFADQPGFVKLLICVMIAYVGFYFPIIYVNNVAAKRKQSITRAWPDALDLMLICVESGMSVEAAFKKVSEEIGSQSIDLAEELVLTNAELSFLQERRQAFENFATRTGVESVKSVTQALMQAERYGTPVAHALRVLAAESRDQRMNNAEKKAAALPPKLTVPMIVFFLPVLFAVILGPAGMTISQNGGFGPGN